MESFLQKLSSYEIFNYLFSWIIFTRFVNNFSWVHIPEYVVSENIYDILMFVFVLYFIWLIVSRFGSIIIESILKKLWLEFVSYKDYIKAEKIDNKIETLSMRNNTYRTLTSLSLCLIVVQVIIDIINSSFCFHLLYYICLNFLLVLFLCSYIKQTNYIRKRVNICIDNKMKNK